MQTSQWIDLQELRLPCDVAAEIDATGITTAEQSPSAERDLFRPANGFVAFRMNQSILDHVFAALFIDIRVCAGFRARQQDNLQRAKRSCNRSSSNYPNREF